MPAEFIPAMIAYFRADRLPLDRLITTYPFERINDAVRDTESGAALKAVLLMG